MRFLSRQPQADAISQVGPYQVDTKDGAKDGAEHREKIDAIEDPAEWKGVSIKEDGDVAQRLFASQPHEPIDPAEEARVVRKIDLMILPYLAVCYAFFYIDKTTLSYAAIFGIREDLHIHGQQYSWLSSIFYFGFLFWALPTNFLMQRFPIGKYLGANIFMWGALLMCQAAARNFATLAVLRALSGAAEACSDPAFMIITSMWYSRRQQPIRMGLWYTANGFGIALGGLLGYGIGHIKAGLPSWKFEFLIIGALCCVWGVVMMIFLPDSPVTAKGLSEREKRIAVERLRDNQTGIENKHLKWYQVREAFTDYKTYLFFLLGVVGNIPNGGISNFGTIIIKGFGFSTLVTTLMQVPYAELSGLYCTGNIAGPFFYKPEQSPRYELGIWSMIVSHLTEVCIILLLRLLLSRENRRRDRIQSALPGGLEGRDLNATAFADLTDR
ncbi:MFS general substrate transporter [Aureobasidium sp. EXF-12298]|nr:MFS general substrate transporter [Aureobasidium sp. EXF-12298]KAI4761639.1 MFS general substrate transporter [Aureobasidium sp. EXF-12344]KAI4778938.1 MFS general substrate transporter [Aureobasidium sp. EXF-3400]